MAWVAGMDEAGRGPVLGPLVVAAVKTRNESKFQEWDVKDSKKITPARRKRLFRLICDDPDTQWSIISRSAEEIDALRKEMTLNQIEVTMFQEAFQALDDDETTWFMDAADVNPERFGSLVSPEKAVTSEHGADDRYLCVGAASILAKVTRDEAMEDLGRRLERKLPYKLGSGYPSDPYTKSFLATYIEKFGVPPEGARVSWKTVKKLLPPSKTLQDFQS